jgi:hypothetical protein
MKKNRQTGTSGNSSWNSKVAQYHRHLAFRVIDTTDNGLEKRVMVLLKNVAIEFDEDTPKWIDARLFRGEFEFELSKPNFIHGSVDGVTLDPVLAVVGRKYGINEAVTAMEDIGAASSGSEIQVLNNGSSGDLSVEVRRSGRIASTIVLAEGSDSAYQYQPTFWILVTTDLDGEFGDEDFNTEISTMGVTTAHVEISGSGPYSLSLTNIT